jgi:hypothetical protein
MQPRVRDGAIEIPVRLAPRVYYLGGLVLFASLDTWLIVAVDTPGSYGRLAFHIGLTALGACAIDALRLGYGIVTRRSKLTVNSEEIVLGKHQLKWDDVHHIARRPSSPILRLLAIGPASVRVQANQPARHLDVTHDHVKDLDAFATWLRQFHETHTSGH